jgi:hypothetical protein
MEEDILRLMNMRITLGLCRSKFGWTIIMVMEGWHRRCLRRLAIYTIIISNITITTSLEDSRARLRRLGVCCRALMVRSSFLLSTSFTQTSLIIIIFSRNHTNCLRHYQRPL